MIATTTLLAILAALAGAGTVGTAYGSSLASGTLKRDEKNFNKALAKDKDPSYSSGWFTDMGDWLTGKSDTEQQELLNKLYLDSLQSSGALDSYGSEVTDWFNSLSDAERNSLLDNYWTTKSQGLGGKKTVFDQDAFLNDLNSLRDSNFATEPNVADIQQQARDEADALANTLLGNLDEDRTRQEAFLNDSLSDLQYGYDNARQQLIAQQNQQNARTADSLVSGMERSRRNALTAGASAGVRIADNINVLMSNQNKQTATSLQTSNNLAQMLLNQQSAAAGLRSNYANYMSNQTAQRNSIEQQRNTNYNDLYSTKYNSAMDAYNQQKSNFDTANSSNALYNAYSKRRNANTYNSNYTTRSTSDE